MAEEKQEQAEAQAEAKPAGTAADSSADTAPKKEAAPATPEATGAERAGGESPTESAPADSAAARRGRGRGVRVSPVGVAHIKATFNNTIISITDPQGHVVSWSSAGQVGFSGSRKSTAFAATTVAQDAARQAAAKGMHEVEVRVQGAGSGRESAIRAIQSSGLNISVIKDVTPVPHNGCRARKRRRV